MAVGDANLGGRPLIGCCLGRAMELSALNRGLQGLGITKEAMGGDLVVGCCARGRGQEMGLTGLQVLKMGEGAGLDGVMSVMMAWSRRSAPRLGKPAKYRRC